MKPPATLCAEKRNINMLPKNKNIKKKKNCNSNIYRS
jgi:hypothetical protein